MSLQRHGSFITFGIGSIGTGIYSTVPGLLLMFYMTNTLGISVGWATTAVFAPKIIDVITDPLMGYLSDRTRSRWGRRRPYLLAGALCIGPLFACLFSSPAYPDVESRFYFVVSIYIACTLAYTVFAVPYIAISAEMPRDYEERNVLNAYRMSFVMLGILASGSLAPTIIEQAGGGLEGYRMMSITLGVLVSCAMVCVVFATRNFNPPLNDPISLTAQLKLVAGNRPFLILLSAYVLQLTASSSSTTALAYFATYVRGGGGHTIAAVFLMLNIMAILSMPVWPHLSSRLGKLTCLSLSVLLSACVSACLIFVDSSTPDWLFMVMVGGAGIAVGGQQLFSFSMLGDAIMQGNARDEGSNEAIFAGFFTASEKTGMALGALVAGTILSWSGLVETTEGKITQSEDALRGILIAFTIAPALLMLASLIVLRFYREFDSKIRLSPANQQSLPFTDS